MSEEQLKAFIAAVKANPILQEKIKAAAQDDAVASIAREAGFIVSTEDLKYHDHANRSQISDEELEGIAGGGRADDSAGNFFFSAILGCSEVRC